MGEGHPECPERLAAIEDRLLSGGLELFMRRLEAPLASLDALLRVHDAALIESVLGCRPAGDTLIRIDLDTFMNAHSADAALRAAGAAQLAVNLVLSGKAGLVFCAVRPPGHHAERGRAMGFCFFNNIAVAAAEALARGIERVAILDFDVHYGNGTADIFKSDPRVLFCSTYQDPLYPYWEGDASVKSFVDVPLAPGAGSVEYRAALQQRWLPALERFKPQMLFISAGFDAHTRDPLAGLKLSTEDFQFTGQFVMDVAARHCQQRVVATLEGGYDLQALAASVEAFIRPFVGA